MDVSIAQISQIPPYAVAESTVPVRPVDRVSTRQQDEAERSRVDRPAAEPFRNPGALVDGRVLVAAQEQSRRDREQATQRQEADRRTQAALTELTEAERRQVQELRQRDAEVRQHEASHRAAGVGITGAASYEYERGPDGRLYAVGGEVSIDISPAATPEATIRKMDQIIRAAMAPAEPSAQDRAVAAQARAVKQQAQIELQAQKAEGTDGDTESTSPLDDWIEEQTSIYEPEGPFAADIERGNRAYAQAAQTLPRLDQIIGLLQGVQLVA